MRLVRSVSRRHPDVTSLTARMESIFDTFCPTEAALRRLSIMQQRFSGHGGEAEYCILLVYSLCMLRIAAQPPPRGFVRLVTRSAPPSATRTRRLRTRSL
mgnify:FL=1